MIIKIIMANLLCIWIHQLKAFSTAIINSIQKSCCSTNADTTQPQSYNRSTFPVHVYMYNSVPIINESEQSIDEHSLLNPIDIIIPAEPTINWLPNTRLFMIFNVQTITPYILRPSADTWTITQKLKTL